MKFKKESGELEVKEGAVGSLVASIFIPAKNIQFLD